MAGRATRAKFPAIQLIANRYNVEKTLGQGGMAVVHQVVDTLTGKKVALKQLLAREDNKHSEEITRLFEYEFHALAQLAHPRVIEVYDYGTDDARPYYTMELLDGGDLRELSPLPWKKACSLMIDVCSALGLLHSRHQVHRDLTPLNIRCTKDGKAKLIDFGALAPMGPCKRVIGSPAFIAPEVVSLQTLDARTDLYSLGATFYYIVSNQTAFPARTFADLPALWACPRPLPSAYKPEIPKELDQLILSLISPDPIARPINAAEVMERLSAIAGMSIDDELRSSQAYLSTPTLIGRDEQMTQIKECLKQARRAHGRTFTITGSPGVGRSRLLDAYALEGKVSGVTVLRADASDAYGGDWGVVRALSSQLLELIPEQALTAARPYVTVLGHAVPELLERFEATGTPLTPSAPPRSQYPISPDDTEAVDPAAEVWGRGHSWRPPPSNKATLPPETIENPKELRPRLQAALRDWLLAISERRVLMVAVDDVHRIDEPSAAFLALFTHEIRRRPVVVAVTFETDAPASSPAAINLLKEAGTHIEIGNLSLESTETLLGSLFGEVPNLALLADRLYAICQGNPRAVMQLTQHLIDRKTIYYKKGTWTLPEEIDARDLPSSISDAFIARIRKLSPDALMVAQALALSADRSFSYGECLALPETRDTARVVRAIDELVVAEILSTDGTYYRFSQQGWVPELIASVDAERARQLHGRIAAILCERGHDAVRAARHLLNAGQEERALDIFLKDYQDNITKRLQSSGTIEDVVQALPPDWTDTLERLLGVCERLSRPPNQTFQVHSAFIAFSSVTVLSESTHLRKVVERLYRDSGLYDYHALGESVPLPDRLWRALELAQQRYDSSPESERIAPPAESIRHLAQVIVVSISYIGSSFDYDFFDRLPSLEPLVPLAPALDVIEKNVISTSHISGGRAEQARKGYMEILARMNQPDHAGIDDSIYEPTRLTIMFAVALIEASLGRNSALKWIEEFESKPLFQVTGWRIRMLYYLRQGDTHTANQCKKRLELLQIQHSPAQFFEGTHLTAEILVYSSSDDLVGVKQTIDRIQVMANRYKGWVPILIYAQAEYHRICGDYSSALAELDQVMRITSAGRFSIWAYAAGGYIYTLISLGRFDEAKQQGVELLKQAVEGNLDFNTTAIKRPLALAEAKVGNYEAAITLAQSVIDQTIAAEITGLNLGLAYETRARVAIEMKDQASFKTHAELCAEQYKTGHNRALATKYQKLMQDARQVELSVTGELAKAIEDEIQNRSRFSDSEVATLLGDCHDPQVRAQRVLSLLVQQCNCSGGFLYMMQKQGPVLSAHSEALSPSAALDVMVQKRISAEIGDDDDLVTTSEEDEGSRDSQAPAIDAEGEEYRTVLLGHYTQQDYVITGLALLLPDKDKPFVFPDELVNAVSKTLLASGDVPLVVSNG